MEQTFRLNIADLLPKDKKPKSNQKTILSIKRRALPIVPAYSITTHKSQGQTLKRLADLIILRHFDYKVLLTKPSKSQLAEIERLDKLYIETQLRFSQ